MSRLIVTLAALFTTFLSLLVGAQDRVPLPLDIPDDLTMDDPVIDEEALAEITQTEGGELTRDIVAEVLAPQPGGLTPDQVVARAQKTSPTVAIARAELRAAAARVDQAFAAYFPTATLVASYTRVSEVPTDFDLGIPLPPGQSPPSFPVVLNHWSLVASLDVPISDYLLRLTQAYAAVSDDVDARGLEVEARKLQVAAEAKVAYFNWIRARGRGVVSGLAVALTHQHLGDARLSLSAGLISEADLARLESQLAQARSVMISSLAFEKVAAEQLRRTMHAERKERMTIGIDVLADPPPKQPRLLGELQSLARQHRLDIQALQKTKSALEEAASAQRGSYYPRIGAFANAIYANPNQRIFPQDNRWDFTWDVGVRLTWTINDTFSTIGAAAEADARAAIVVEQLRSLEDGISVAVTKAYYDIETARAALAAAKTRETSSTTSLRVRRQLFRGGDATATEIVDAESDLIQARLQRVDAAVNLLVARAQLELAVGTKLF